MKDFLPFCLSALLAVASLWEQIGWVSCQGRVCFGPNHLMATVCTLAPWVCWAHDLAKSESIQLDRLQKSPSVIWIVQKLMLPLFSFSFFPSWFRTLPSTSQLWFFQSCWYSVWYSQERVSSSTCAYRSVRISEWVAEMSVGGASEWAANMYLPLSNASVTSECK